MTEERYIAYTMHIYKYIYIYIYNLEFKNIF